MFRTPKPHIFDDIKKALIHYLATCQIGELRREQKVNKETATPKDREEAAAALLTQPDYPTKLPVSKFKAFLQTTFTFDTSRKGVLRARMLYQQALQDEQKEFSFDGRLTKLIALMESKEESPQGLGPDVQTARLRNFLATEVLEKNLPKITASINDYFKRHSDNDTLLRRWEVACHFARLSLGKTNEQDRQMHKLTKGLDDDAL